MITFTFAKITPDPKTVTIIPLRPGKRHPSLSKEEIDKKRMQESALLVQLRLL